MLETREGKAERMNSMSKPIAKAGNARMVAETPVAILVAVVAVVTLVMATLAEATLAEAIPAVVVLVAAVLAAARKVVPANSMPKPEDKATRSIKHLGSNRQLKQLSIYCVIPDEA